VANRYTTSSMAFQTARVEKSKREEFLKWLYEMEYKELTLRTHSHSVIQLDND